jgi:predicted SAM-dependent methyltransferase
MIEDIILFGASKLGKIAKDYFEGQYNIIGFCDNDRNKWGKQFEGYSVVSVDDLVDIKAKIIIASTYHSEISKQLIELGFDNFEVFSISLTRPEKLSGSLKENKNAGERDFVAIYPQVKKDVMNYLNLGCGGRFHSDWVNVDFSQTGPGVIAHNLAEGIPFVDNTFDVVYHSHLLEHFPKIKGEEFMKECYRVLRPGGILRVAVPDLEQICRLYIDVLEKASTGDEDWQHNYDWILLEMYDQCVRNQSGGEMLKYLMQEPLSNEQFVSNRLGSFYKTLKGWLAPLKTRIQKENTISKTDLTTEEIGRFRKGGEIHQWMYDRYSLKRLFVKIGFRDIRLREANESYIGDWSKYCLDTEPDETVYKADSLYMEGIK